MMKKATPSPVPSPIPAVGIVCFDDEGRVLLIKRSKPPRQNEWSIPGGKIEWGEKAIDAAHRELFEETGIVADIFGLIDVVDAIFSCRTSGLIHGHYVLIDYVANYTRGTLQAGDDACEVCFVAMDDLDRFNLWPQTRAIIDKACVQWCQTAKLA
ncbi:NUDIX hydrolase [Candidatus Phycosocius spiralis]|uniref:DNA mismatch repair protein MutT n=1 Tax=Candidatus Phycosocius spiralis TaxID=2815099 RepID=A0ABQ4PWC2_9PROT|nr:NUDIX hydrolase [Candidatus Phycosocius spiralis]GIU67357.1 DNA mismatch repair protein MutT [Candidatus Phycosocius spiralis]